jgi:hypothetical protein
MSTNTDRAKHAAPHHAGLSVLAGLLLVALLGLSLTACRGGDSGPDQLPGSVPSQTYIAPDDSGGYSDDPGSYSEDSSGYSDDPGGSDDSGGYSDDPGGYSDGTGTGTDHCAFPGDPLCPDTPIRVPPPDVDRW